MITTVIFDLDGLLADTEKLHRRTVQEALAEFGVTVSEEQYDDYWIRRGKGIVEFIAEHRLSIDPDDVRPLKARLYRELVLSSVEAMPGALSCLKALRGRKTLALATSSHRHDALVVLETLGILAYFACVAAKLDAKRPKPAPDIFLGVAATLKVGPHECVVVEDAEKGILAAHAAGMKSIAIPNTHTRDNDFSKASMMLPSLRDLTLEKLEAL